MQCRVDQVSEQPLKWHNKDKPLSPSSRPLNELERRRLWAGIAMGCCLALGCYTNRIIFHFSSLG